MEEQNTITCKYCYTDFSSERDVINPCKCSGSMKFICRSCINQSMKANINSEKFSQCQDCKEFFKIQKEDKYYEISSKAFCDSFFIISCQILIAIVLIVVGIQNVFFVLFVFLIYILTLMFISSNAIMRNFNIAFLVFYYLATLFMEHKYSFYLYSLWILGLLIISSISLLDNTWNSLFRERYNTICTKINSLIFDNNAKKYVSLYSV